jgi:hypothetical protein
VPSPQRVEKKAIFFVYKGLSSVDFVDLPRSSVSPVKDELSTFMD